MKDFDDEVVAVMDLGEGGTYFVNMGEDQGGEIMRGCDMHFLLYEVTWGGYNFEGWYKTAEEAVKVGHKEAIC
jgi:hypothetical protein